MSSPTSTTKNPSKIFRRAIASKLIKPEMLSKHYKYKSYSCVGGKIPIGRIYAKINVLVHRKISHVITKPPIVFCQERWMKDDDDWHNDSETGMCWVVEDQWKEVLAPLKNTGDELIQQATDWIIIAASSLVYRHYYGHIHNLDEWPERWEAYSHGKDGRKEYRRENPLPGKRRSYVPRKR